MAWRRETPSQICTAEISTTQIGAVQIRATEVTTGEIGACQVGLGEGGADKLAFGEVEVIERRACEVHAGFVDLATALASAFEPLSVSEEFFGCDASHGQQMKTRFTVP